MTLAELSKKYGVHSTQIGTWKPAAIENMATAFTRRGGTPEQVSAADVDKLHSKIGQLVVERDFLPPPLSCMKEGSGCLAPVARNAPLVTLALPMHCRAVGQKMVSKGHKLSVRRQCALLTLTRSNLYYEPKGESAENLRFMEIIDKQFLETPWYGSRQMARHMKRNNHACGRHRARRLMRRGFLYLVAIMDWYSRKVLAWRLSNSMDAAFCVEALKEALANHGTPEIFNTDQGSQFTSGDWIDVLTDAKTKISMDGKGRWIDNRMIERLRRSLKYECVYLHAFETGSEAKAGIGKWLAYYNVERPHSTQGILTPDEAYASKTEPMRLAA